MPDIKHAITIEAPPERIRPLVASGAGFAQWWAEDVTEDAGKKVVELGFFKRTTIYRLELTRASATETEWLCSSGKEWQGTKLLFRLNPNKEQTAVRFAHAGWQGETDYLVSCNTTWGELLFRLKAVAEGKTPGPLFTKTGLGY